MNQPGAALAGNLQKLREDRNLSLEKLAEMTGVSKSMLRQIEIGQSTPTIATIWKIANGLRVPFTALLRVSSPEVTLQDFKINAPLTGSGEGYRLFPLVTFDPERAFEVYYVELDPGATLNAEPHQGNAEEFVFVQAGQMAIRVAGECHRVNQGQMIRFHADCEHGYENLEPDTAKAIMLISYLA